MKQEDHDVMRREVEGQLSFYYMNRGPTSPYRDWQWRHHTAQIYHSVNLLVAQQRLGKTRGATIPGLGNLEVSYSDGNCSFDFTTSHEEVSERWIDMPLFANDDTISHALASRLSAYAPRLRRDRRAYRRGRRTLGDAMISQSLFSKGEAPFLHYVLEEAYQQLLGRARLNGTTLGFEDWGRFFKNDGSYEFEPEEGLIDTLKVFFEWDEKGKTTT